MIPKTLNARDAGVRRAGFTLAEVLVTLAIIAVMAAVLLPALNSQLSKGDTGRLTSDLTNIQTAAQAFVSDVHRYPTSVSELTTAITATSTSMDITGGGISTTIPATLVAKWKGPYLTKDVLGNTAGGAISATFTNVLNTTNSVYYLTVSVTGVSLSDFNAIDAILDEGATGSTTGSVRYNSGSSTLTFLALPLQ